MDTPKTTQGIILKIHQNGTLERLQCDFPLPLTWLQEQVGGMVEEVRLTRDLIAYVNEEGRMSHMNLPDNARYPNLAGVILIGAEWTPDPEEGRDMGPLTVAQLRMLEGGGEPPDSSVYMERVRTLSDADIGPRIVNLDEDPMAGFRRKG